MLTQEPALVGLVAAAVVMTFLAISFVLLVVSTGGSGVALHYAALEADLLAATPIGPDGQLHIPFGTLYLTARNP